MRPKGATFWLIGGRGGWLGRTAQTAPQTVAAAVSDKEGVRLAARAGGPLSLASSDDSLGGLLLPQGMAFDEENTLYLLSAEDASVRRFDPDSRTFQKLPAVGGVGPSPRQFDKPSNIAVAGRWLYVADTGNRRVQIFELESLALTEILNPSGLRADWNPADLAEHGGDVYILDSRRARIYRHTPGGRPVLHRERADRAGQWSRIAVDRQGRIYLLNATDPARPVLEPADPQGQTFGDAGALRDLFESPALRLDERGRFCLPPSLARPCGRQKPAPAPAPEIQLALCAPFDKSARRCQPPSPPRTVRTAAGAFLLYVLEREQRRVRAYTDGGRKLRHTLGAGLDWEPVDVAARGMTACVLDGRDGTVYRHRAGRDALQIILPPAASPPHFSRIAMDERGLVYLHAPGASKVRVHDCAGKSCGERPYGEVAELFEAASPPEAPALTSGLVFDRQGNPVTSVDARDASGELLYKTHGMWRSTPLDSRLYRCQWHRIELAVSALPPGSSIEVSTYAHELEEEAPGDADPRWQPAYKIVAPHEPPNCEDSPNRNFEFLVQSIGGRFLSVRVVLQGDGFATPAVRSMKVHYPRESYLRYLPGVWSADDEGRLFLERFLAIFQTEWDAIEREVDGVERYFDPDAVPEGPFLDHLAKQWLALPLEGDWKPEQKRRLLAAAPKIYPHRGKLSGLRDLLAVYLANIADLETDDVKRSGFPVIVEGFREREHIFLAAGEAGRLGQAASLWSASVIRRLQVGVFCREGEVELVSTGDPERDIFHRYAHRFRVFVPASWVRTADDERTLRRAIEAEKPAQTDYDLCLLQPTFRVGVQSTVDVDTIIGATPVTALGCMSDADPPPGARRSGRLGLDTVLTSAAGGASAMRLAPGTLVARESLLA